MEIRLETRDESLVSYATIPEMTPRPEIVLWGERTFATYHAVEIRDGQMCHVYREGMAWVVQDPTPRSKPAA